MPDLSNLEPIPQYPPRELETPIRVQIVPELEVIGATGVTAIPPVVSGLTPAAMTTVARTQVHEFDFTDDGSFTTIIVAVGYPSGRWDLVYNGTTFMPEYAGSTIAPISGGFHLEVSRVGGWAELGALKMFVEGVDTTGQQNS